MSTDFTDFATNNSSFTEFGSTSQREDRHDEFFRGFAIDAKPFLPVGFFQAILTQSRHFADFPRFSQFRKGFSPIPEDSLLFDFHHHPKFRKLVKELTSLNVENFDSAIRSFDPSEFHPVRTCRFICSIPKTGDFETAFRKATSVFQYNRIRPENKIRFQQTPAAFVTEFNFFEFQTK